MSGKTLALLLCTLLAVSAGCGMPGLKGHWSFDDGTVTGGENVGGLKPVEGKTGKALMFDGKGCVKIPHAPYFHSPAHTITAWTKLENTGDYQYIAWKAGPVYPEDENLRRIDIWVNMDGTIDGLLDCCGDAGERIHVTGDTVIADGTWHMVAWVNDGKTVRLYVDGTLDTEADLPGPLAKNEFPLWIGARPNGVAATGIIDEFRYFARALDEKEIAGLCGSCCGTCSK